MCSTLQVAEVTAPCRFLHRASLKPSDAAPAATAAKGSEGSIASLTEASTLEQHPAVFLQGQATNHKLRTEFSTARLAAFNAALEGKSGQNGPAGSCPARTATWNLSEQLDFIEFLQRQNSHLQVCLIGRSTMWHSRLHQQSMTCLTAI